MALSECVVVSVRLVGVSAGGQHLSLFTRSCYFFLLLIIVVDQHLPQGGRLQWQRSWLVFCTVRVRVCVGVWVVGVWVFVGGWVGGGCTYRWVVGGCTYR